MSNCPTCGRPMTVEIQYGGECLFCQRCEDEQERRAEYDAEIAASLRADHQTVLTEAFRERGNQARLTDRTDLHAAAREG